MSTLANLKQLEDDLWEAADELRANSNLPYNEFFLPVMGIIFLGHAANRFEAVDAEVQADRASGRLKRAPVPADYVKRRSLCLPESARYDRLLPLLLLPPELTGRFETFVRPLCAKAYSLKQQDHHLCNARDLLPPRLTSGETEV
jgi:hypothetical protein